MGDRLDTPARMVAEAVQDLARMVVRAIDEESALDGVRAADDPVSLAAARVLGADVLAPGVLASRAVAQAEITLLERAVRAFPPDPASQASLWTHWGARVALGEAHPGSDEPGTQWLADEPWPRLAHQFAGLAMLAGLAPSALTALAAHRVEDLSRGFVRAVRRRDWRQAAGVGRWLAAAGGLPPSLGLTAGLDFVDLMGAEDALVALHVRAARILSGTNR